MKKYSMMMICMALLMVSCEKDPDLDKLDNNLVVYTDHDTQVDFTDYKTYYLPDSILEASSHKVSYWSDENAKAIIDVVAQQMNSRGYTRITNPEEKDQADLGVQLSYLSLRIGMVPGNYYNSWWNYDYWGPWWGGWYYPCPISLSYETNSLIIEMLDLTKKEGKSKIPVIWYAQTSGFKYYGNYNQRLLINSIDQAFEQSEYINIQH